MGLPPVLATDSNIWMDLQNSGILAALFRLRCQFMTNALGPVLVAQAPKATLWSRDQALTALRETGADHPRFRSSKNLRFGGAKNGRQEPTRRSPIKWQLGCPW